MAFVLLSFFLLVSVGAVLLIKSENVEIVDFRNGCFL